ncbi:MAG: cysteine--tRNA ligase [Candidatus Moranbacteria bacterium]|nr:cysteine--tRNA ligase [Candidatus Moranbacteria bacterium]MBP6034175.1 cysteine--tRNA ligase [Candidatus Moranbacteria bacterium]MBP7696139.1 cysteine--tRNA ligase [Candidatus Moranbacteria bacterium]
MQLHNTLTKSKELFEPINPGKVGLYTCGPTVYDFAHIGNLRSFVFSDTLRRVLERAGYEVRHIKNITDVGHMTADDVAQGDSGEDKIAKKALSEHKTPEEIARFYEERFREDEAAMHILPAHYFPRATAHIPHMIKTIEALIESGHAYEKNGNVFFDVTSFKPYGALSGNTLEKLKVGARLEEHPDKRHPWDFALWLKAPAGHLMHWTSPWSEGYPGWHIECSSMSQEYLGDSFDIHTGGEDNIFPHHEAEIAQSECSTGKPFVRYWIHSRHILVDGTKMSKSKGNFYRLADILERGFTPMDLRLSFLSAHYRSQMNFTWESLEQARKNKESIFKAYARVESAAMTETGLSAAPFLERFIAACEDDLNTPLGLAILQELVREVNSRLDAGESLRADVRSAFEMIFSVFGLAIEASASVPTDILALAEAREAARSAKDFTEADRLRDEVATRGYTIEDTPEGPRVARR